MMLIGLTGLYCAGKNRAAALLEKRGFAVLDVDKLGHKAIEAEAWAIQARFGADVLGAGGRVDRRRLGAKVFGRPGELAALEAIVHPAANRLTEEWIAAEGPAGTRGALVINAALLHRSSVFGRLDFIIVVTAPLVTRLLRARRRDGLAWRELVRRFWSQRGFKKLQTAAKNADIYIAENPGLGGRRAALREQRLERRIGMILAEKGID